LLVVKHCGSKLLGNDDMVSEGEASH